MKQKRVEFIDNYEFQVSFAGLFDTVPSYLLYSDKGAGVLNLDAVKEAEHILHLTALDERRTNFSLNRLPDNKSKFEKGIPGVHCDVGGSYNDKVEEKIDKMVFKGSKAGAMAEINYQIEDGWYKEEDLVCNGNGIRYWAQTNTTKLVLNNYSFITLHIMKKRATLKPVSLMFKNVIDAKFKLPDKDKDKELFYTNDRLNKYVFSNANPMKYHTPDDMVEIIKRTVKKDKLKEIVAVLKDKEWNGVMQDFFPSDDLSKNEYKSDPITTTSASHQAFGTPQLSVMQRDEIKNYNSNRQYEELKPDEELEANELLKNNLDEIYYKDYPELQQKIKDHNVYKFLRYNYFHKSYRLELVTDKIVHAPYKASVRDTPSRNIIPKYE